MIEFEGSLIEPKAGDDHYSWGITADGRIFLAYAPSCTPFFTLSREASIEFANMVLSWKVNCLGLGTNSMTQTGVNQLDANYVFVVRNH